VTLVQDDLGGNVLGGSAEGPGFAADLKKERKWMRMIDRQTERQRERERERWVKLKDSKKER
jgi:hypothetical protein